MQSSTVSRDTEKFSINFYGIIFQTRSIIWTFWIQIFSDSFKCNLHVLCVTFGWLGFVMSCIATVSVYLRVLVHVHLVY